MSGEQGSKGLRDQLVDDFAGLCLALDNFVGKGTIVDRAVSFEGVTQPNITSLSDANDLLDSIISEIGSLPCNDQVLVDVNESAAALNSYVLFKRNPEPGLYLRTVRSIYGLDIEPISSDILTRQKAELQARLKEAGFDGEWPKCLRDWRDSTKIDAPAYLKSLERFLDRGKQLTENVIFPNIVGHEEAKEIVSKTIVSLKAVDTEEKWTAYCFYNGGFRADIEINSRAAFYDNHAALFSLHESFPGHVAEAALREYLCEAGRLHKFYTLQLLNSPRNLLSEGLADYSITAFRDFLPYGQFIGFLDEKYCTDYRHNIGLALTIGEITTEQAMDRLMQATGHDENHVTRSLAFVAKWDCYFPTYSSGYYVVENALARKAANAWRPLYLSNSIEAFK